MEEPEKYVNWAANALLMVSDIYDYCEYSRCHSLQAQPGSF
jgi:hypothetical protein